MNTLETTSKTMMSTEKEKDRGMHVLSVDPCTMYAVVLVVAVLEP